MVNRNTVIPKNLDRVDSIAVLEQWYTEKTMNVLTHQVISSVLR